jgi:hypothetical protein
LDVLPERDGDLLPLIVQRVQELAVPGIDDPRRGLAARVRGRQPGHGNDALHAEQAGDADRLAQVLGMLRTHLRVGVERVAVDVQSGQRDPGRLEQAQVVLPRGGAREQLRDRQVRRGDEPARIDLGAGQAHLRQDLERLRQGPVVQARRIGA